MIFFLENHPRDDLSKMPVGPCGTIALVGLRPSSNGRRFSKRKNWENRNCHYFFRMGFEILRNLTRMDHAVHCFPFQNIACLLWDWTAWLAIENSF
jgi:hypothetical protein